MLIARFHLGGPQRHKLRKPEALIIVLLLDILSLKSAFASRHRQLPSQGKRSPPRPAPAETESRRVTASGGQAADPPPLKTRRLRAAFGAGSRPAPRHRRPLSNPFQAPLKERSLHHPP